MRRVLLAMFVGFVALSVASYALAAPKKKFKEKSSEMDIEKTEVNEQKTGFKSFPVFNDQGSKTNHFAPSGWMGDYGDLKIDQACKDNPHSGTTCIKVTYNAAMSQGAGWTGMYWQHPANNWGDKKGGYNLTGATKMVFWARGKNGGEKIAEFKIGGITGEFPDSDSESMGPIELSNKWQKYTIDLKEKDLSHIIGGFCWSASRDENPEGLVMFLDDISYE